MYNDPAHQTVNLEKLVVNSYHNSEPQNLCKCSGYYTTLEKLGWLKHEFTNGLFYQFGSRFEEFESGAGNYTTAIVELTDGRVVEAVVSSIKFER